MSDKELRELDAWIAVNVMGWKPWDAYPDTWLTGDNRDDGSPTYRGFHPTVRSHEAMEVLRKCVDRWNIFIAGRGRDGDWIVSDLKKIRGNAETLELAICLAAKQLFADHGKPTSGSAPV